MNVSDFFPNWRALTEDERTKLERAAVLRTAKRGTLIHGGSSDCTGLLLICAGQLRAYIVSADGREITLYRLLERDVCLFSASCMLHSMPFDITIRAETDASFWLIPAETYRALSEASAPLANYTNRIMADRFSDVMWLMEQILWKSFDRRLAEFLLSEAALCGTRELKMTHEEIGNHLGTAREVVTRMLHYFQSEGVVRLARGTVHITNAARLEALAAM